MMLSFTKKSSNTGVHVVYPPVLANDFVCGQWRGVSFLMIVQGLSIREVLCSKELFSSGFAPLFGALVFS